MRTEKPPPPCLSDVVEQMQPDGSVKTPGRIGICLPDCPYRAEAEKPINPEMLKQLGEQYRQGKFMTCAKRQKIAGL